RTVIAGLTVGILLAFSIPKSYESTVRLMPPDDPSSSNLAMMMALSAKMNTGLGSIAGELLGVKSPGALFVGIFRSWTVESRLVERFDLTTAYSKKEEEDACRRLEENTAISEDRQSGIIKLTVTDRDPRRAAAIAQAYVEELDHLVS